MGKTSLSQGVGDIILKSEKFKVKIVREEEARTKNQPEKRINNDK